MRALLVAAGRGTRLGALTANRPKPMLPIGGVPMIERIMSRIAEQTDIREFVLVTGYLAPMVEDYFGDGSRWDWHIHYVRQDVPRGLADAVNQAKGALSDAPFLMTYGDIMMDPANYGNIVTSYQKAQSQQCKIALGLNWVDDPWAGAAVTVDANNRVLNIQEKPPKGTATTHWNNAGLFVFDPMFFDYTAKVQLSARGEYELPDAILAMIQEGYYVQGVPLVGEWRDVGTPADYAAINEEYAAKTNPA